MRSFFVDFTSAFVMALISSEASAQRNLFKMIEGVLQDAASNKARKAWSRISPTEAACVESALRSKGSSIDQMIQAGVRPNDPRLGEMRNECKRTGIGNTPQEASSLSDKPTFDCSKAQSATGRIICLDKEGAEADWKLVSASWALRFTLPASERKNFDSAEEAWLLSLNDRCRLDRRQSSFTSFQRNCVLRAYSDRTAAYRSRLTGDALVEAELPPEDHSAIQKGLVALGLLNGEPDGEFGDDTRAAIKQFRTKNGESEQFFLTAADRLKLLQPQTPTDRRSSTCTVIDPTGTALNVRNLPNGEVTSNLINGTKVVILRTKSDLSGGKWALISDFQSDHALGWAFLPYLNCDFTSTAGQAAEAKTNAIALARNAVEDPLPQDPPHQAPSEATGVHQSTDPTKSNSAEQKPGVLPSPALPDVEQSSEAPKSKVPDTARNANSVTPIAAPQHSSASAASPIDHLSTTNNPSATAPSPAKLQKDSSSQTPAATPVDGSTPERNDRTIPNENQVLKIAIAALSICLLLTMTLLYRRSKSTAEALRPTSQIELASPPLPPLSDPSVTSPEVKSPATGSDQEIAHSSQISSIAEVKSDAYSSPEQGGWFEIRRLLFSFDGRIDRSGFWQGSALCAAAYASAMLATLLFDPTYFQSKFNSPSTAANLTCLLGVVSILYMSWAVGAKRCHDRNLSGWHQLLLIVPVIGALIVLIELGFLAGDPGPNRFGSAPRNEAQASTSAFASALFSICALAAGLYAAQHDKIAFFTFGPDMKAEVINRPVDTQSVIIQLVVTSQDTSPFTIQDVVFNGNDQCRASGKSAVQAEAIAGLAASQKPKNDADLIKGITAFTTGIASMVSAAFNDQLPKNMTMGRQFSFGLGMPQLQLLPGACNGQTLVRADVVTDKGTMTFNW